MENISIIFTGVKAPDPLQYLSTRIALLHYANQELLIHEPEKSVESASEEYARQMAEKVAAGIKLPLSAPIDVSNLVGNDAARIRDEYACMVKELKANFPLLSDETVEHYEVAYLMDDYDGHRKQSVVFRQVTNYAECCYIYPYISVEPVSINADGTHIKLHYNATPSWESNSAALGFSFSDLPMKIAEALASKVGSKLGAMVLKEVWPNSEDVKVDLEKIGAIVEKIVSTELTKSRINQAVVQLTAYMKDVNTEYLARKGSGASAADLFEYLKAKDDRLKFEMVSVFMYTPVDGYSMEAVTFNHFLLGASVHLAHLQEKASLKPTPEEKAVVSAWAKAYRDYAAAAIPRVADARIPFISPGLYGIEEVRCTPRGDCFTSSGYEFRDDYNGYYKRELYSKKTKDEVHNRMAAARFAYRDNVVGALKRELTEKTQRTLNAWKTLEQMPLP